MLHPFSLIFNVGPRPPATGTLAAHVRTHLSLLPSGPDEVHELPLRKTHYIRPQSDLKNKKTDQLDDKSPMQRKGR